MIPLRAGHTDVVQAGSLPVSTLPKRHVRRGASDLAPGLEHAGHREQPMVHEKLPQLPPHLVVRVVHAPAARDLAGARLPGSISCLSFAAEVVSPGKPPIEVAHVALDRPPLTRVCLELLGKLFFPDTLQLPPLRELLYGKLF